MYYNLYNNDQYYCRKWSRYLSWPAEGAIASRVLPFRTTGLKADLSKTDLLGALG